MIGTVFWEGLGSVLTFYEPMTDALRKPTDGIVSRWINRPLSLAITRRLANTRVMPNHISIFTMLLGLSSGLLVMQGGYWMGLSGAFLLQVQSVLDGVDGELARLRSQTSRLGQWLDTISDDLASLSFLIGCCVAVTTPFFRWIGIAGIVSFLVTQTIIYYSLATVYHSGDLFAFSWKRPKSSDTPERDLIGPFCRHDFLCLAFLPLALLGRLDLAIALSSIAKIRRLILLSRLLIVRGLKTVNE